MRFDWTDLRVFLHACEAGSMTGAARRASLTLAAVSARILAMEEGAGVALLRRHARGVAPTPAGEALARHARLLFQQAEMLRRDLAQPPALRAGRVLLLANSAALLRPLQRPIADVLRRHGARVLVREGASEVTVHALQAGAADVGIVSDAVATQGLVAEDLGSDPLVLIAPPSHPLASRAAPRLADVLPHDWIGLGEDSALHTHLAMQAQRAGVALDPRAGLPSARGVVDLVARGFGVSVVPQALLRPQDARRLAVLPLAEPWARRRLLVCRGPGADAPAALALFQALKARWRAGESAAFAAAAPG